MVVHILLTRWVLEMNAEINWPVEFQGSEKNKTTRLDHQLKGSMEKLHSRFAHISYKMFCIIIYTYLIYMIERFSTAILFFFLKQILHYQSGLQRRVLASDNQNSYYLYNCIDFSFRFICLRHTTLLISGGRRRRSSLCVHLQTIRPISTSTNG